MVKQPDGPSYLIHRVVYGETLRNVSTHQSQIASTLTPWFRTRWLERVKLTRPALYEITKIEHRSRFLVTNLSLGLPNFNTFLPP